jgi:hypothetical protein
MIISTPLYAIQYQAHYSLADPMPNEPIHRASDRVRVELIEADVDIAFGLVDDALEEFHDGNVTYARAALGDAE